MRILLLALAIQYALADKTATRNAAVSRAIEQTKSRQSAPPAQTPARTAQSKQQQQQSPGKSENIDVDRLNRLIRALDKTWINPRTGAKEPVGSNFQYKKTCASIYKARHGACQQLGFGVMCFNYCHERGEKLSFRCQDASDAAYCRQSGTFETFLAKYRKDGYKAKAYIHQMISRCYATAICNTQTGILNSTIIDEEPEAVERTTQVNRLKLLTKGPKGLLTLKGRSTTEAPEAPEEEVEEEEEATTTTKKRLTDKKRASPRPKATPPPEITTTTTGRSNIWDKFTVGQKAKPTPKYIPFWQRLMTTSTVSPMSSGEEAKEETMVAELTTDIPEEVVEEKEKEKEEETTVAETSEERTTPKEDVVVTKRPVLKTNRGKQSGETRTETTARPKHTFKPLPMTTPPQGPELAFQKPGGDDHTQTGPGFWNRFQPNRWFQSIHYVTNTGRR